MKIPQNKSIYNQFKGFIKMPNLFLNTEVFSVESFETIVYKNLDYDGVNLESLSQQKYLGKRAEYFMKAYLDQNKTHHPIFHSLQIQNNKNTLGELDFLFFDNHQQQWIHLELICKFYVFTGEKNQSDLASWIGPNLKDRLDYKIQKLKNHQLQICQNPYANNLFEALKINEEQITTKLCYKAKLYLPLEMDKFTSHEINNKCIAGNYYNFETFKTFKYSASLFYVPHKHDWLCQPETNQKWYDYKKAKRLLKPMIKEKRSQLLWRKTKNGQYFEDFVVWW